MAFYDLNRQLTAGQRRQGTQDCLFHHLLSHTQWDSHGVEAVRQSVRAVSRLGQTRHNFVSAAKSTACETAMNALQTQTLGPKNNLQIEARLNEYVEAIKETL